MTLKTTRGDLLEAARIIGGESVTVDDDARTLYDYEKRGTWVQAWVFVPDPEGK